MLGSPQTLNEMMDLFRRTLARIPTLRPTISHIPFDGGLVGFSSYDMVRFFEHLPVPKDKEGILSPPDCAYLAPTSLLVFVLEQNSIALLVSGTDEERLELAANVLSLLQSEAVHLNQSISYSAPTPNIEPEIFIELNESLQSEVLLLLTPESIAKILRKLESDNALQILENLEENKKKKVLDKLSPQDRFLLEEGLSYPEDSAARIMQREFTAVPSDWTCLLYTSPSPRD